MSSTTYSWKFFIYGIFDKEVFIDIFIEGEPL